MKKALFALLLLAAGSGYSQRHLIPTSGSWNYQNLSVETYQTRVVTACSETNPSTGLVTPSFRVTDLAGTPAVSFFVNFPGDPVYLMDFTVNTTNQTIVLTGMTAAISATTPYKMYVCEVSFGGTVIQTSIEYLSTSSNSMVPHQIIHSPTSGQVVIVGTQLTGIPTPNNGNTMPKDGFVLALDANNFNNIIFSRSMSTPTSGTTDNDMLENITEVPGTGYFISGSANNSANEQNLLTMGINYTGGILHSNIHDLTNFQMAGSSVMFLPAANRVYVVCNDSQQHTFLLSYFNPATGAMGTNWWRHVITTLPVGSGVDVNGFRLQYTQNNQIILGGYVYSSNSSLSSILTPFQMVFNPNVAALVAGKLFQSANNSPLSGYFSEIGNSVYVNTPDMISYSSTSGKTYIVNQNTVSNGYDLIMSSLTTYTDCEKAIKVNSASIPTVLIGPASYTTLPMYANSYTVTTSPRTLSYNILCSAASALAPEITLAPNPANETVQIQGENGVDGVMVVDMNGQDVTALTSMEQTREGAELTISRLKTGMYVLIITDHAGNSFRERLVKE